MSSDRATAKRIPENVKLWRANADARAEAKAEALRQEQRDRMADYVPANVRTYGEPWDSMIAAAAESSAPRPESPNRGSVKRS